MPVPDDTMPADYPYARAQSFRIYRRERVKAIEATAEFQKMVADRLARRNGLGCRGRTPIEQLLAGIEVPVVPWDQLAKLACDDYNLWCRYHRALWTREISADSSPHLVARVCVNYLRHNLTDYDELVKQNVIRLGIHVYPLLKRAIIEQIARHYPRLVRECYRQLMRMSTNST
jgi:hypothetical protein